MQAEVQVRSCKLRTTGIVQDNFGDKGVFIYDLAEMITAMGGTAITFKTAIKGSIKGEYLNTFLELSTGTTSSVTELMDALNKGIKAYEKDN